MNDAVHCKNVSRQFSYEDLHSLSDNVTGISENIVKPENSRFPECPRVIVCLHSVPTSALLDTGSQITAMSETFYEYLKQYHELNEFPVTSVVILTAIGKKTTHIKRQIMCERNIGQDKFNSVFFSVPHLSNDIILGNDWLLENKIIIDYRDLRICEGDKILEPDLITFSSRRDKDNVLNYDNDIQYIQMIKGISCNYDPDYAVIEQRGSGAYRDDGRDIRKCGDTDMKESENVGGERGSGEVVRVVEDESGDEEGDIPMTTEIQEVENTGGDVPSEISFMKEIESIAIQLTELNNEEKLIFIKEMSRFKRLFSPKFARAETIPYKFKVKPHRAVVRKSYPVVFIFRDSVRNKLQEMLEMNVIEYSDAEYCSPLRIVIKADGSVRVCLDARFINEIIEADNEAPPIITELMQKFFGTTFMSTVDFSSRYWL